MTLIDITFMCYMAYTVDCLLLTRHCHGTSAVIPQRTHGVLQPLDAFALEILRHLMDDESCFSCSKKPNGGEFGRLRSPQKKNFMNGNGVRCPIFVWQKTVGEFIKFQLNGSFFGPFHFPDGIATAGRSQDQEDAPHGSGFVTRTLDWAARV